MQASVSPVHVEQDDPRHVHVEDVSSSPREQGKLMHRSTWRWSYLVAIALALGAAATGWFVDDFYAKDGVTLAAKGRYGDLMILAFVAPLGLVAFIFDQRNRIWARAMMIGVIMHLGFKHGVLAFDYHENVLFVIYAAMVGLCLLLCVTGLIDFAGSFDQTTKTLIVRVASIVLLLVAISGLRFWLSDVINALIDGTTAKSLSGTNLPANAARVLDMAIMLPLTAFGAVKLWSHCGDGLVISAVMSTFLILVSVTVIVMEVGLAKSTHVDLDTGKIAAYGAIIGLSLFVALVTYRTLGLSTQSDQLEASPVPERTCNLPV